MLPNQQWHCNLVQTVMMVCHFCSTFFIVVMTFERFYSIIRPHKAASFNTIKRAKITIMCIVIFSSFYNIPDLFITLSTGRECFVSGKYRTTILRNVHFWLRGIIVFFMPFFSLLVMNSYIIDTLRCRSIFFKSKSQGQIEGEKYQSINYDKQVYITLLLVTFTFLFLFTPIYVFGLIAKMMGYSPKTAYSIAATFLFLEIAKKMYYTIYGINFFLYIISGPKFRKDLLAIFQITKKTKNKEISAS